MKVRRPDIIDKVRHDRAILLAAGARRRARGAVAAAGLARAPRCGIFCDAVEEQLHFTNEAANNARFQANFAADPEIDFPRLRPELCTDGVLTMEFVDGVREGDLEIASASTCAAW